MEMQDFHDTYIDFGGSAKCHGTVPVVVRAFTWIDVKIATSDPPRVLTASRSEPARSARRDASNVLSGGVRLTGAGQELRVMCGNAQLESSVTR
jgi:hypothetical protein